MTNSSSFLALVSFLLIRVTMIDETMLINWLAMDGWPKCGLATVCFDAIPLQEVHITCVALNWRRMLFKLSTFWGTLEPWYLCLDCFFFSLKKWERNFLFRSEIHFSHSLTLWRIYSLHSDRYLKEKTSHLCFTYYFGTTPRSLAVYLPTMFNIPWDDESNTKLLLFTG